MQLSELKTLHVSKLLEMATELAIESANRMRKQELIYAILKALTAAVNVSSDCWSFNGAEKAS